PDTAALPYPASLAQAIASYSLFLGAPPDSIFYYPISPIPVLYATDMFGIGYKMSGHLLPSVFCGVAGMILGTTNIETVRTPLFLTIDMIAQLIFIAIVLFYLDDEHGKARRWTVLVLGSAFLLYFYYYELIVVGPLLVFMLTEPLTLKDSRVRKRVFRVALVLLMAAIPIPLWAEVKESFQSRNDKHWWAIVRTPGPERRFLALLAVLLIATGMMMLSIPAHLELHDAYLSVDEYDTAM